MPTETLTLPDFLLARIAEDEDGARDELAIAARPSLLSHQWLHVMHRVLAECEAKRLIVAEHEIAPPFPSELKCDCGCDHVIRHAGPESCGQCSVVPHGGGCFTLLALALPYADHPDYREEWKP